MTEGNRQGGETGEIPVIELLDREVEMVSESCNLDQSCIGLLGQYAHSAYKARIINRDFQDPEVDEKVYMGWSRQDPDIAIVLNRANYRDYSDELVKEANRIYGDGFSGDTVRKLAIRDILAFIDKLIE